jgi:hypothetical protein
MTINSSNDFQMDSPLTVNRQFVATPGTIISLLPPARLTTLYYANVGTVASHWIVICNVASPISGSTTPIASFYNPGTANTQFTYDLRELNFFGSGFSVSRSTVPNIFTTSPTLATPSYVQLSYRTK